MYRAGLIIFDKNGKPFLPLIIPGPGTATGPAEDAGMKPYPIACFDRGSDKTGKYGMNLTRSHGCEPARNRYDFPAPP